MYHRSVFTLILCGITILSFIMGCGEEENQPPTRPDLLGPAVGSVVSITPRLGWHSLDPEGDQLTYNVYLNGVVIAGREVSNWHTVVTPLDYNTEYTWYVVARDSEGEASTSTVWSFRTEAAPVFDIPDFSDPFWEPSEPVTIWLLDETVRVPAGGYKAWELPMEKGDLLYLKLESDTDVNVWLLTPREYEAFKNNETFRYHAEASRKKTLGFTVTYVIPEKDTYYFVLDNKFSWFTSKVVSVYLKATR